MRWSEDTIARVKEANDVVEIISQHLPLTKAGANFKALCPFHQEKTPSFMVNPSRQIFHCFGCSTGGDVIRFIMLQEGLPFVEAVEKLADRAGIDLPQDRSHSGVERGRKETMLKANRLAAEFYGSRLMKDQGGAEAREYLGSRGIHSDVSKVFGIGYAPGGWRSLLKELSAQGISSEAAAAAGLAVRGEGGKEPYDRFRNRVVFPIRDLSGRILGFGGRVLGDELPKYINTPETSIYRKGDSLFGMDVAAPAIREAGEVLLVEGFLDVISLHQGGIKNVVGVLGTALTSDQARKLKRLTARCVLLLDADEAGRKAAMRSGLILLEEGFSCRVAPLAPGEDPDSFLRKRGKEALEEEVVEARPLVNFVLDEARERHPGRDGDSRFQVLDAIVPYLAKIKDRAAQGIYIRYVAEELKIEQHDLRAKLTSLKERKIDRAAGGPIQIPRREELLTHIMIRDPSTIPRIKETVKPEDFSSPLMSGLVAKIYAGVTLSALMGAVDEEIKSTLSRWALEDPVGGDEALNDCLRSFQEMKLDREIQETQSLMEEAERRGEEKRYQELLKKCQDLQIRRNAMRTDK